MLWKTSNQVTEVWKKSWPFPFLSTDAIGKVPPMAGALLFFCRLRCLCTLNANLSYTVYSSFRRITVHLAVYKYFADAVSTINITSGVTCSSARMTHEHWTSARVNETRRGFWSRAGYEFFDLMQLFAVCLLSFDAALNTDNDNVNVVRWCVCELYTRCRRCIALCNKMLVYVCVVGKFCLSRVIWKVLSSFADFIWVSTRRWRVVLVLSRVVLVATACQSQKIKFCEIATTYGRIPMSYLVY